MYHANQNIKVTLAFIYYEYLLNKWMHDKWDWSRNPFSVEKTDVYFPPSGNSFLSLIHLSNFQCIWSWYLRPPTEQLMPQLVQGFLHIWESYAIFWMAHEAESYFKAALLHVFLRQLTQPQIMGPNLKPEAPRSTQFSQSEHCGHRVHGLMCGLSKAEQVPGPMSVQACLGLWPYIFSNALPVRLLYSSVCSLTVISGSCRQSTAGQPYVSLGAQ